MPSQEAGSGTRSRVCPVLSGIEADHGSGVGLDDVVGIQRARVLAAMVVVVAERGVGNVRVAHVVARSGVSRRRFYELFADREECFLAAFDEAIMRIARVVVDAFEGSGVIRDGARGAGRGACGVRGVSCSWRERVRAGLIALLVFLEEEPELARLLIVESLAAGPEALERRTSVLAVLRKAVEKGQGEARAGMAPAAVTAEGIVGAVLAVLHGRLLAMLPLRERAGAGDGSLRRRDEGAGSLVELAGPLMSMIVLPYLGPVAARRELERPVPSVKAHARHSRTVANPLDGLGMRLTYRTMRVLMVVAAGPGLSNRGVADSAGISDQGQVSKLLARLMRAGLLENTGSVSEHGVANAWRLTEKGREVHGAIAPTTSHV